jgi:aspartyl-tRNA(Asn)/glutamyl-tRNA(Gln) amidotransferase subunit A
MEAPNFLTAHEAVRRLREGNLSVGDLRQACLNQVERLDPSLHAFITVAGPTDWVSRKFEVLHLPLPGIPVAVKDLFDTAGMRTTSGARFFRDNVPETDATVVKQIKNAGAFVIGKTNMHEVALGVTTVNPHYGACRNPWNWNRIAGGSSGGSAVAVSAGMALAALGTDTGGSIRIPASLCGVVGLKPTYGRVSLRGVFPLSWNLDHAGPLTRDVRDAAMLLEVIAGYDSEDPYAIDTPVQPYVRQLSGGIKGWRIALLLGDYLEDVDTDVRGAVEAAAAVLAGAGATVIRLELPCLREAAAANGQITQADGAAVHQQRLAEKPGWFGDDVRRRLESGRDLPSADYILARHVQVLTRHRLSKVFEEYQVLLLPTTPVTAPLLNGNDAVAQARRLTRFTAPFNLCGLPAVSIPCGFDKDGLPIGLQIVAGPWQESTLLRAATAYEAATSWGNRRPPQMQ